MHTVKHVNGHLPAQLDLAERLDINEVKSAIAGFDDSYSTTTLRDIAVQSGATTELAAVAPSLAAVAGEITKLVASAGSCVVRNLPLDSDVFLILFASLLGPVTAPSHQDELIEYITPADVKTTENARYFPNQRTALGPHTDSALMARPHQYLMFATYENRLEDGGHTVLLPAAAVVEAIKRQAGEDAVRLLSTAALPFRSRDADPAEPPRTVRTIFEGTGADTRVRYQNFSLRRVFDGAEPAIDSETVDALRVFDAVVSDEELWNVVGLENGEVLIFDNCRSLHGRTAIEPAARRFLKAFHIN
ncbi:TauD/TfdA family dioxygenase [Amycolatopsis sp. GM8]|uniref:TauD/TfdA family dioxygenase n=1 Tax=Amycolatopsis sp. GM8 TaxID=2896530 RepID=UPI001F38EC1F|nr:TauD/TfdA family dioxygenase [Amycolatopsis sp. GM8]